MINNLHILLITYNRAPKLSETLRYLAASSLCTCRITILDNASTDGTSDVISEVLNSFSNLNVIRHVHNIGLGANYLRALEVGEKDYLWVIGDDDKLILNDLTEIGEILRKAEADLVYVGGEEERIVGKFKGKMWNVQDANSKGFPFFKCFSFIPSLVFKKSLIQNKTFFEAYKSEGILYPHFILLSESINLNSKIIFCHTELLEKQFSLLGDRQFLYFRIWLASVKGLKNPEYLRKAQHELCYGVPFKRWIFNRIVLFRHGMGKDFWPEYLKFMADINVEDRSYFVLRSPIFFLPLSFFGWITKRDIKRKALAVAPENMADLINSGDSFRS